MRRVPVTRPATLEDLMAIEAQEAQRFSDPRQLLESKVAPESLRAYLDKYSWTLESEGKPVACIGIVPLWPGVASCWGLFSEAALRYPTTLFRFALDGLAAAESKLNLRRIETTAPRTHLKAHRWLEHLGFQSEGIARAYGFDGSDHVHYARVH